MNKNETWFFTSESVTEGHPDKVCDQIADAVLDAILTKDANARVACEAVATAGMVLVTGEITTTSPVEIAPIVRATLREIGYDNPAAGFDADTCAVITAVGQQSPDIANGVNRSYEVRQGADEDEFSTGAGDQGMMFGFACNETPEKMPLPISLAHALCRRLAEVRKTGLIPYLLPDGKSQVTMQYEGARPVRVDTVVVSTQHTEDVSQETIAEDMHRYVIEPVIPAELLDDKTRYLINPSGRFVVGGPRGDSGLTGRKIIVDTYGGFARHGGGSFSGKDPTKVDRTATYAARYVAKNVVAAGLADRCEIQLSYAIGVAQPVSVMIDTAGTGVLSDAAIADLVCRHFDLRPAALIRDFGLCRPLYRQVAAYGHLGRPDLDLPWEKTDKAETLRRDAGRSD
ncbi:MAG: methionine adenosyltransferase [Clostridiaceae bacterium]|jgi:S-adenosylmethionine synthetase|nr:methionine adenosyltransferase [Clostridiaceae bacterium]